MVPVAKKRYTYTRRFWPSLQTCIQGRAWQLAPKGGHGTLHWSKCMGGLAPEGIHGNLHKREWKAVCTCKSAWEFVPEGVQGSLELVHRLTRLCMAAHLTTFCAWPCRPHKQQRGVYMACKLKQKRGRGLTLAAACLSTAGFQSTSATRAI